MELKLGTQSSPLGLGRSSARPTGSGYDALSDSGPLLHSSSSPVQKLVQDHDGERHSHRDAKLPK
eukprot:5895724-Amphidinium_carterae.1